MVTQSLGGLELKIKKKAIPAFIFASILIFLMVSNNNFSNESDTIVCIISVIGFILIGIVTNIAIEE